MRKDKQSGTSLLLIILAIIVAVILFNPMGLGTMIIDAVVSFIDMSSTYIMVYGMVGLVIALMLFFAWRVIK